MRRVSTFMLIVLSMLTPVRGGVEWQGAPAASQTSDGQPPLAAQDERLLALLPPADLVGVVDLPSLLVDLLPRLDKLGVKGASSLAAELNRIATALGIEPKQLRRAVFSITLESFAASGLVLIEGADPDQKKVEGLLKGYQVEYRSLVHEGVTILTLASPPQAPALGPLSINTSDISYASLGEGRIVIGELSRVRQAIERRLKPAPPAGVQATALREANPASMIRFAFILSPEMREAASSQGDLFKSIAAISVLVGDLGVGADLALSLNAVMRTPTTRDAQELEQGLKGLVNLGRVLLASGDPNLTAIINQVRISVKDRDVALKIALPSSFIEQMSSKKS